ncbi:MAG: HD domain-containing protein [Gemmatimonadetes bacterium]|nr:HD domain-containing protein [Gemmatimonadota bacterium]
MSDLPAGDTVRACYAVLAVHESAARAGGVEVLLADARERVVALVEPDVQVAEWLQAGVTVGVRGSVLPGDTPRIAIDDITPVQPAVEDLELFLPRSRVPAATLDASLAKWIDSVRDVGLRELLSRLLSKGTRTGDGFRLAPAAMRHHHAVLGGLLEHTLSVAALCEALAAHYGGAVDRDLLIAGALLHDIGKTLEIGAQAGFPHTDEGRLLGHVLLGLRMVEDAAKDVGTLAPRRLLLLLHLIASHQGRYEWQSPREPRIIEALMLHHADNTDAKIGAALDQLERVPSGWSEGQHAGKEWLRHTPAAETASLPPVHEPRAAGAGERKTAKPKRGRAGAKRDASRSRARRRRRGRRARRRSAAPANGRNRSAASPRPADSTRREAGAMPLASPLPMDGDTLDLFGAVDADSE